MKFIYKSGCINMIVKKIYLSDIENIERSIKRALALKAFGSKVRPSIAVEIGNDFISISQAKIKYDKTFVHGFTKGDVVNLAIEIDKLHAIGAVHGDLCTSNLALKKDKLYIFDWEPTLELKEGVLRTTSYCVHPSDLKNGFISELTDRYAVLLLAFMVKINLSLQ